MNSERNRVLAGLGWFPCLTFCCRTDFSVALGVWPGLYTVPEKGLAPVLVGLCYLANPY